MVEANEQKQKELDEQEATIPGIVSEACQVVEARWTAQAELTKAEADAEIEVLQTEITKLKGNVKAGRGSNQNGTDALSQMLKDMQEMSAAHELELLNVVKPFKKELKATQVLMLTPLL